MDPVLHELEYLRATANCELHQCTVHDVSLLLELGVSLREVHLEGDVRLGAFSYANPGSDIRHSVVGRYCSIGDRVKIAPNTHEVSWLSGHPMMLRRSLNPQLTPPETTHVGHDVWIGSDATILRGVRVGNGAVIAAAAVVTKDVPDFAVVAGIPARVLRYRFEDHIRAAVAASQWWNYNFGAAAVSFDFSDVTFALATIADAVKVGRLKLLPSARQPIRLKGRALLDSEPRLTYY